jgi:transposase
MEAGKTRLALDTFRDASKVEVDNLKRENERLKQLVADLSLQVHVLKKSSVFGKTCLLCKD